MNRDAKSVVALEEFLVCPLCCGKYRFDGKIPKIVRLCGHSFCEECLDEHLSREKCCPLCNCAIDGGLDLADNESILKALEELVALNTPETARCCGHGEVCLGKPTHKCLQCPDGGEWLCDSHLIAHGIQKNSRNHTPIRIDELKSGSSKALVSILAMCETHSSQEKNVFCATCDLSCCQLCAISKLHRGHETDMVTDVFDKHSAFISERLESTQRILEEDVCPARDQIFSLIHHIAEDEVFSQFFLHRDVLIHSKHSLCWQMQSTIKPAECMPR